MAERRIIDLKSGQSSVVQKGVVYRDGREIRPLSSPAPFPVQVMPKVVGVEADSVEWKAYEYENRIGTKYGIWAIEGIALLLVLYGIVARSYLFMAFVVIAFTLLYFFAKRTPRLMTYSVTPQGVCAGGKRVDYSNLQSFWIFEELHISEVSLETKNKFQRFMALPLGDINPDTLREVLKRYLPEKQQEGTVTDQIARILGF